MSELVTTPTWSRRRLSLPLWLLAIAFLIAAGANVLLVLSYSDAHAKGNLIVAYTLGAISDLAIAAGLAIAALIVGERSA